MGEIRSSLSKISLDYSYYFFLIGDYEINTPINSFFNDNFKKIGSDIGENAVIVRRTDKSRIERELNDIYTNISINTDLNKIAKFFKKAFEHENKPGLLIMNRHPSQLLVDSKIAYISFAALEKTYPDKNELLRDIVGLAQNNDYTIFKKTATKRKIVDGISISINLGVLSINFDLK